MNKFKRTFFVYQVFFTLPWFILQYFVPKLRLCKVQFVLDDYLECLQLFKYNLLNYFETKWCVEIKEGSTFKLLSCAHFSANCTDSWGWHIFICTECLVFLQVTLILEPFHQGATVMESTSNSSLSIWKPPAECRQSWEGKRKATLLLIKPTQNFSYSLPRQ